MTRGRASNTAHLVAETLQDAKQQWIDAFARDRSDLGPARARDAAIEAIEWYGPAMRPESPPQAGPRRPEHERQPVPSAQSALRGFSMGR